MRRAVQSAAVAVMVCTMPMSAQTRDLDFDRPEAWGMKYAATLASFTGFGVPSAIGSGVFEVGVEGAYIPQLSDTERRVGFDGTKLEDMNKSRVFGRVRARLGVGGGWAAELGLVPPLSVGGAKPLMIAAALGGPIVDSDALRVGVRGHGQLGRVQGDITCDEATVAAGLNSAGNPFNCEDKSDDEVVHRYGGVELSAALPRGSWEPYVAVSANYVASEFRVNARYSGIVSTEILKTSGATASASLGVAFAVTEAMRLSVEGLVSPLSVIRPPQTSAGSETFFNVRAMASYRVH